MYAEILGDLMARRKKQFDFDDESDEPAHILARYIRQKLGFAFDHPELSRIFTTELLSGGQRLAQFRPDAVESTDRKLDIRTSS